MPSGTSAISLAGATPPDLEQAEAFYRQGLGIAEDLDILPWIADFRFGLGHVYRLRGAGARAREKMNAALALYRSMEMEFWAGRAEVAIARLGSDR